MFAINLTMRKCIYILWQKCMLSKKGSWSNFRQAVGLVQSFVQLWSKCWLNINSNWTRLRADFSSLDLPSEGQEFVWENLHQEKLHICKKTTGDTVVIVIHKLHTYHNAVRRYLLKRALDGMFYVCLICLRHYLRRKKGVLEVLEWHQVQ